MITAYLPRYLSVQNVERAKSVERTRNACSVRSLLVISSLLFRWLDVCLSFVNRSDLYVHGPSASECKASKTVRNRPSNEHPTDKTNEFNSFLIRIAERLGETGPLKKREIYQ